MNDAVDVGPLLEALGSEVPFVQTEARNLLDREMRDREGLVDELARSGLARTPRKGHEALLDLFGPFVSVHPSVRDLLLEVATDLGQWESCRAAAIRALRGVAHEDSVAATLLGAARQMSSGSDLNALLEIAARFPLNGEVAEFLEVHARRGTHESMASDGPGRAVTALRSLYARREPVAASSTFQLLGSDQERMSTLSLVRQIGEVLRDVEERLPIEVVAVFESRVYPALGALEDAIGTAVSSESALIRLQGRAWEASGKVLLATDIAVGLLSGTESAAQTLAQLAGEFAPLASRFIL